MDPIFLALATALAARFGSEGAGAAWSALVRLVRGRAAAGTGVGRALEAAQAAPAEEDRIRQLADELRQVADSDTDFAKRIHELWPTADRELAAHATQNQISGVVLGNAVQTGTLSVNGDLNFGQRLFRLCLPHNRAPHHTTESHIHDK